MLLSIWSDFWSWGGSTPVVPGDGCFRLTEDGGYRILENGLDFRVVEICGVIPITNDPNGNRQIYEYQPTYHELRERREIERKFEEAQLDLKAKQIRIEDLEFKRLHDLSDQAMQMELLQLLAQQYELQQLLEQLQQQKLRALNEDDEFVFLMTCLYN